MKRARHKQGSVVFDKRRRTWNYLFCENGVRRTKLIGSLREYPTKASAWQAAEDIRQTTLDKPVSNAHTLRDLAQRYQSERMPSRSETARVYGSWLRNHILPHWGDRAITEVQPRPVELWLRHLELSPKSKSHVRNLLRTLIEFAMWSGVLDIQRNPIDLVVVRGATKRIRKPRCLTVEDFQKLQQFLKPPFDTMALSAVCLGLRVSELLALKWSDVDWLGAKLKVERGIVKQIVDDVKTDSSRKSLSIDKELLEVLKAWKRTTQFSAEEDWIFASPLKLGRLPYSYTGFWRELEKAAGEAGIGHIGTHAFRHTYRSWLDAVGTPIAVQQKLMRHSDIRTTMNIYGDVVTDEMGQAHSKVVGLALSRKSLN
jgi:integrase